MSLIPDKTLIGAMHAIAVLRRANLTPSDSDKSETASTFVRDQLELYAHSGPAKSARRLRRAHRRLQDADLRARKQRRRPGNAALGFASCSLNKFFDQLGMW